ncbi:MAG: hypothetical protein WCL00_14890 [Bacteroidota bacterium]
MITILENPLGEVKKNAIRIIYNSEGVTKVVEMDLTDPLMVTLGEVLIAYQNVIRGIQV